MEKYRLDRRFFRGCGPDLPNWTVFFAVDGWANDEVEILRKSLQEAFDELERESGESWCVEVVPSFDDDSAAFVNAHVAWNDLLPQLQQQSGASGWVGDVAWLYKQALANAEAVEALRTAKGRRYDPFRGKSTLLVHDAEQDQSRLLDSDDFTWYACDVTRWASHGLVGFPFVEVLLHETSTGNWYRFSETGHQYKIDRKENDPPPRLRRASAPEAAWWLLNANLDLPDELVGFRKEGLEFVDTSSPFAKDGGKSNREAQPERDATASPIDEKPALDDLARDAGISPANVARMLEILRERGPQTGRQLSEAVDISPETFPRYAKFLKDHCQIENERGKGYFIRGLPQS